MGIPPEVQAQIDQKNEDLRQREEAYWQFRKTKTVKLTFLCFILALFLNSAMWHYLGTLFYVTQIMVGTFVGYLCGRLESGPLLSSLLFGGLHLLVLILLIVVGAVSLSKVFSAGTMHISAISIAGWFVYPLVIGLYNDFAKRFHI